MIHRFRNLILDNIYVQRFILGSFFICTFFSTWGSGFQNHFCFDISKLFIIFAAPVILDCLFRLKDNLNSFPKSYNFSILFFLVHAILFYIFVYPDIEFGIIGIKKIRYSNLFVMQEANGIKLLRMLLFMIFAYNMPYLLKSKQNKFYFALIYLLGLSVSSMISNNYILSQFGSVFQFSGGFLDPNYYSMYVLFGFWLSLYIISLNDEKPFRFLKVISYIFMFACLYWILIASSRGIILALIFGIIVFLCFFRPFKKAFKIVFILILCILTILIINPEIRKNLTYRFHPQCNQNSSDSKKYISNQQYIFEGSGRLEIWNEYLAAWQDYFLLGQGELKSTNIITKSSVLPPDKVTHNTFLEILVEYGIFGLLLFLFSFFSFGKIIYLGWKNNKFGFNPILGGIFISLLVVLFFYNILESRFYWLAIGIISTFVKPHIKLLYNDKNSFFL